MWFKNMTDFVELTAKIRSALDLGEATEILEAQLKELILEARIDELQNLFVDFDERKLRHINGTKLTTIDKRLTQLEEQKKGLEEI